MVAFVVMNCLVKMTLRLFWPISVVMNMVPMFLRQFRRLAQGHCWSYPSQKSKPRPNQELTKKNNQK